MSSPYPTIYSRIVESAVNTLHHHRKWNVREAVAQLRRDEPLFEAYIRTFSEDEFKELVRIIKSKKYNR